MMSQAQCPHCGAAVLCDPNLAGHQVACPTCNGMFVMPAPVAQSVGFAAIQTDSATSPSRASQTTVYVNQSSQALPALCSFFVPGLGQLVQGRILAAVGFFLAGLVAGLSNVLAPCIALLWTVPFWIWCIVDAARYRPGR